MKKIFYFIASAIVALGAVACDNQDLDNIAPGAKGEGLTITATIDEATKVIFDGMQAKSWEEGDFITVGDFKFDYVPEENVFRCTAEDVLNLADGTTKYTAYANELNSAAGIKGSTFVSTEAKLIDQNVNFVFKLNSALLKFTTTETVTLTASADVFGVEGVATDELEIKGTGELQYVAVYPTAENVTFSYSVNDVVVKETEIQFTAKQIYNLGALEVSASGYNVVGSFQGWDVSTAGAIKMYQYKDWAIAKGVELYKSDEFKIVKGNSWNVSYGLSSAGVLPVDTETKLVTSNSQNMKAAKNGKFDIYFNGTNVKYVCVEEYTDLTVDITIDNKANWSPLYITLKNGETTIVENATVTGNKYTVSGNYIGESLSYTLSNGSKTMEGNVSITKDGATINLEELAVKTTIVLQHVKSNQQQYWGNVAKIHVWNTGTSFDTNWPGNTMTKTGTYTWSIDVPSELIGKTINFLIHNGNGWQSPDSKITIKEGENKVTDESLGIK